jgi:hypothetical protein
MSKVMRADQTRGCSDEIRIVPCLPTIRQQRDVLQPRTDTMPSLQSTSIDGPTREVVTVVNLRQRDARRHHNVFNPRRVLNSRVRIGVKRLDQDASTSACQAGTHESPRVVNAQQSSLDTDASG